MSCERILHTLKSITSDTADAAQKEILDQAVKAVGFLGRSIRLRPPILS